MTVTATRNNNTMVRARKIIKAHADARGCKYRIVRGGEVHYYGTMTNTRHYHSWYLAGMDWQELAADIEEGRY